MPAAHCVHAPLPVTANVEGAHGVGAAAAPPQRVFAGQTTGPAPPPAHADPVGQGPQVEVHAAAPITIAAKPGEQGHTTAAAPPPAHACPLAQSEQLPDVPSQPLEVVASDTYPGLHTHTSACAAPPKQ